MVALSGLGVVGIGETAGEEKGFDVASYLLDVSTCLALDRPFKQPI